MPRLVVYQDWEPEQVFEIAEGRPVSIGRAKSCTIVLDDPAVSRLHAILHSTPDGHWQIVDRSNSNGLQINGRAAQECLLRSNDEMAIGKYRLRFEDSAARKITSYGAARLPAGFTDLMSGPAYSSAFLPVEPLAGAAIPATNAQPATVDRMKALENENRLLKILYRASRMLGELQVEKELLARILDLTLEIEGAERGYTMLLDENPDGRKRPEGEDYAFLPAVVRYRSESSDSRRRPTPQLAISRSIIRQVMRSGLPILITDGRADPRFSASGSVVNAGIQSAMCAPLGADRRLRGLLYVDNLSRAGMFTAEELNVFAVIALQAGLALDRLREKSAASEPLAR